MESRQPRVQAASVAQRCQTGAAKVGFLRPLRTLRPLGSLATALALLLVLLPAQLLVGCQVSSGEMRDGYYTAEASNFDSEGWKDYLTIYVADNQIVTVEFDAYSKSGFLRSWDSDYQSRARAQTGLHPSEYLRTYTSELLNLQNPSSVLVVVGAERQHKTFQLLADAAIAQAKAGDSKITWVDLS